jgi:hypothetical protein
MAPQEIVYYPNELANLRAALERVCASIDLAPESVEAEEIATRLLQLFGAGTTDVDQLVSFGWMVRISGSISLPYPIQTFDHSRKRAAAI